MFLFPPANTHTATHSSHLHAYPLSQKPYRLPTTSFPRNTRCTHSFWWRCVFELCLYLYCSLRPANAQAGHQASREAKCTSEELVPMCCILKCHPTWWSAGAQGSLWGGCCAQTRQSLWCPMVMSLVSKKVWLPLLPLRGFSLSLCWVFSCFH